MLLLWRKEDKIMKKAVVLLSGGLDSTTALYLAKNEGFEVYSICFDYGQKHNKEFLCAENIAKKAGVEQHVLVKTNLSAWGGSALTDDKIDVPEGDVNREGIPVTYVPARNMIFLSYAASFAEVVGAQDIFMVSARWTIPGMWTADRNSLMPWRRQ